MIDFLVQVLQMKMYVLLLARSGEGKSFFSQCLLFLNCHQLKLILMPKWHILVPSVTSGFLRWNLFCWILRSGSGSSPSPSSLQRRHGGFVSTFTLRMWSYFYRCCFAACFSISSYVISINLSAESWAGKFPLSKYQYEGLAILQAI